MILHSLCVLDFLGAKRKDTFLSIFVLVHAYRKTKNVIKWPMYQGTQKLVSTITNSTLKPSKISINFSRFEFIKIYELVCLQGESQTSLKLKSWNLFNFIELIYFRKTATRRPFRPFLLYNVSKWS